MAPQRINKQKAPRHPRKPHYWGSKDARSGLPQYDCQSPVSKHQKFKRLDCEIHAKILHERLQRLLETQDAHEMVTAVQESANTVNPIEPAPVAPPQQIPAHSQPSPRKIRPQMVLPYHERPQPIPMEVPRINPNFHSALPVQKTHPMTASTTTDSNYIPLFDPASLLKLKTQEVRSVASTNFTGYTSLVGISTQLPSCYLHHAMRS